MSVVIRTTAEMPCKQPRRIGQRGSTVVEIAIALTLLLTVIFGIMAFGWALFAYDSVSNGAREGARWAIVHGSQSSSPATSATVLSAVKQKTPGLNPSNLTVTTT